MTTIDSIATQTTADGTTIKAFFTTNWSSGEFIQYSNGIELRTDWGNGTIFADYEEARADYDNKVCYLPLDWRTEYNCSNGRFHGGFGAKLDREVWEVDEDGELVDLLECETLYMAVWDGSEWVAC